MGQRDKKNGKQGKGQLAGAEISRWRFKKKKKTTLPFSLQDVLCCLLLSSIAYLEVQLVLSALFSSAIVLILSTIGREGGNSFYFTYQPQRGYVCNCWGASYWLTSYWLDLQILRMSAGGRVKAYFSTAQSLATPFLEPFFGSLCEAEHLICCIWELI